MGPMVAALFVLEKGPYANLPGVDPWPEPRDARAYAGPHAVVAHPPCARWGRYWSGGPSHHGQYELGDDDGCFAAALRAVLTYGGVLEHPADSKAWAAHGITAPPRSGGWIASAGGWTCCVEQGHYGHPARKATWLFAVRAGCPELRWGTSGQRLRLEPGYHSTEERRRARRKGIVHHLSHRQRAETPAPFRDLLLSLARSVPTGRSAR